MLIYLQEPANKSKSEPIFPKQSEPIFPKLYLPADSYVK